MALYKFKHDKELKDAKHKVEKLHSVAIELTTCESRECIFTKTENALKNIFNIADFVFTAEKKIN